MNELLEFRYLSAFLMGLMSGGHCLGMCGGITSAIGLSTTGNSLLSKTSRLSVYNCGRISCYMLLGGTFGLVGQTLLAAFPSTFVVMRVVAGLLIVAMACYVGQWWMGLTRIEQLGSQLWIRVQPLIQRLNPEGRLWQVYLLGLLWGLLPCGLIYSMLIWVGSEANAWQGMLLMLCFGLGTLPTLFFAAFALGQLSSVLRQRSVRNTSALLLLSFGVWTIAAVFHH